MATIDQLLEALESDPTNENRDALIVAVRPLILSYARNKKDKDEYISAATLLSVELINKYQLELLDGLKKKSAKQWLYMSLKNCKLKYFDPPLIPEPRCNPKNDILIQEVLSRLQKHERAVAELLLEGYNVVSVSKILDTDSAAISKIRGKMYKWMRKK